MTDPIIEAARRAVTDACAVLREAVVGLDPAALNARPGGDDTNSIAVLASHAMGATRVLLHVAAGLPEPSRDRPAEFATVATGPEPLLQMIETSAAECLAILDRAGVMDWSAIRQRRRSDGSTSEMTAAYALIHAIYHLRGHADEASLTRHLVA